MNRKLKNLLYFCGFFPLFFLVILVLIFVVNLPLKEKIVFQTCQPSLVHYDSLDPYCLSVIERSRLSGNHFYLFIGRGKDAPAYGHQMPFEFYKDYSETIQNHIYRSAVQWNENGVEFESASGHRIFFPKKMFIGGR